MGWEEVEGVSRGGYGRMGFEDDLGQFWGVLEMSYF